MANKKPVSNPNSRKNVPAPKVSAKITRSFIFSRQNYLLMIASFAIVVIGFVLMYGKDDIYNATKTIVAPIVVMGGLMLGVYAIMYKGGNDAAEA
ncbi:MAG: hypothetical protein RL160_948 [Bacteroidota bacterium]|jgi:hypothetical protein